ncbi:MAG: MFS transporter, partial [Proteobacteria bacterium]|nr:MFS transporter [Pseudomonadota bacterium]
LCVILMATGYPVGVILGGSIAALLLISFDWRSVFVFGAFATLTCIPLVWFLLPESIEHLCDKKPRNALNRINATLRRMGHGAVAALPHRDSVHSSVITALFSGPLLRTTVLLTVTYFCHIMTFYFILKWIPKIVVDMDFHPSSAGGVLVWANVGGAFGSIILGLLTQKYSVRVLVFAALVGAAVTVAIFGQGQADLTELALMAGIAGMFTNSAIVGLYALFADAFPTNLRASGTGLVIGIGRGGAALGPIIAGFMFEADFGLDTVAIVMASGSLLAAFVLLGLRR